jgi:hypothetical protein
MENTEDNLNLKKIVKKCHIYHNHIRCENNSNIYTNSITHDNGTMYLKSNIESNKNMNWEKKIEIYKNISKEMKENEFVNLNYITGSRNILSINIINVKKINDIIFYYPYPIWPFGHYILYGYKYFYYYLYLKKKYPNIKIIMNDPMLKHHSGGNNKYWFFLKKTLDLKNIIYINSQTLIINSGITFCVYSQMENVCKMSNECIEFYTNIGKKSLLQNIINLNLKQYPKKLLFLRKNTNIASNSKRLLKNREQVCKFCEKYNYIDIDQTTYSMEEIIYLMNNATHLITETGSSLIHLLWTKRIKVITLNWDYSPCHLLPNFYKNSNKYFKLFPPGSGLIFEEILKNKNAKVVYNEQDKKLLDILEGKQCFLNTISIPEKCVFLNFKGLEIAIEENE